MPHAAIAKDSRLWSSSSSLLGIKGQLEDLIKPSSNRDFSTGGTPGPPLDQARASCLQATHQSRYTCGKGAMGRLFPS
eukprot:1435281-Amphidinium_carterae.1